MKKLFIVMLSVSVFSAIKSVAQVSASDPVMIGAEIFIEPGQNPADVDAWFRILKENGMEITRIRMFENYMHKPDGTWDFSLFDAAFKAADKYGIKVYANLFPYTTFDDVGGFKFPRSQSHLDSITDYIKHLTIHFKQYKSLYGYVPINEPGGEVAKDDFYKLKYAEWLSNKKHEVYNSNGYPHFDFNEYKFVVDYTNLFLKWLVDEINKYDPCKPMHVNNHQLFRWISQYDFVEWRKFLTSLGGSAHASWHFGYFTRDNYGYAISANSEILRSGAGPLPWFLTEILGGNNIYSGFHPLNPTQYEIAQWLWIPIGAGSKGGMFWCLNPRGSGVEAGEWAMLDFQNHPTKRLVAAAGVAKVINDNQSLFSNARVDDTKTHVCYTRESLWIEEKLIGSIVDTVYEARKPGAVMKSAIAYFEAISRMGLQISTPSRHWDNLKKFVRNSGKLIVDGLTAYYDENAVNIMQQDFPLSEIFGANVKEFSMTDNIFDLKINKYIITIPAHAWKGFLEPVTAKVIVQENNEVLGVTNQFGKGEVVWIPELMGLGARIKNDYHPLISLLTKELNFKDQVFFKRAHDGALIKVLRSGHNLITIVVNKIKCRKI